MKGILGKKLMMTRIFEDNGNQIPVTLIKVSDNVVTNIKTEKKDGYRAVQLGAGSKRRLNKSQLGQLKDIKIKPARLFEIKTEKEFKIGDKININIFQKNQQVNVTANSKGKGFAGTVKRHGFHLGPKTHGSNNYRQPGSIGSSYPQRVIKGRKMPGRLGGDKVTLKNVKIVHLDQDRNLMLIKGAVPGPKNSYVLIWSSDEN
ncbi:MAG: 50S ribosomal protein L3 [Patescibacteria group bacterium]